MILETNPRINSIYYRFFIDMYRFLNYNFLSKLSQKKEVEIIYEIDRGTIIFIFYACHLVDSGCV
jgi:hypothetical protein